MLNVKKYAEEYRYRKTSESHAVTQADQQGVTLAPNVREMISQWLAVFWACFCRCAQSKYKYNYLGSTLLVCKCLVRFPYTDSCPNCQVNAPKKCSSMFGGEQACAARVLGI